MLNNRKETKKVRVRDLYIGGDSNITIQSMTNTDTRNIDKTIRQIKELEEVGCDIVRLAVLDMEAAIALKEIKKSIKIPLVADIHFDYRLALESINSGVDKIRINPGNIGDDERVRKVVDACKDRGVPIRIGVNSGSVEKDIISKYNGVTSEGMVESAMRHVKLLEDVDFDDIIISIKASSVPMTINCYKKLSSITNYPLHLGVTESGTLSLGTIKSSIGIGSLLADGIGDTIRVSLTSNPVDEIGVGIEILKALDLRKGGIEFVSCPTCGRCQVDLINVANTIQEKLKNIDKDIKIAIMGCAVNGPGEAKEADLGIAGGNGEFILFKKGEVVRKIPQDKIIEELILEVEKC